MPRQVTVELKYTGTCPSDALKTHNEFATASDFQMPAAVAANIPMPMYVRNSGECVGFNGWMVIFVLWVDAAVFAVALTG